MISLSDCTQPWLKLHNENLFFMQDQKILISTDAWQHNVNAYTHACLNWTTNFRCHLNLKY